MYKLESAAYIIPEEVLLSEVPSPITNDEFKTAEPNNAILGKDEMEAPENMSENGSISDGLVDINLETKNAHSSNKTNKEKGPHVQRNEKGNETENGIPDTDSNEQLTDNLEEEGNTYYNTVGKRVQVSYLTEYIRSRDQYMLVEEFNVRIIKLHLMTKFIIYTFCMQIGFKFSYVRFIDKCIKDNTTLIKLNFITLD